MGVSGQCLSVSLGASGQCHSASGQCLSALVGCKWAVSFCKWAVSFCRWSASFCISVFLCLSASPLCEEVPESLHASWQVGECPVCAARCMLPGIHRVSRRCMRRSPSGNRSAQASRKRSAHELQRLGHLATTLWPVEVTEAGQPDALALHTRARARRIRTMNTWFWVGNTALWHYGAMALWCYGPMVHDVIL